MSNYPDGMVHTVERCTGWITCDTCGNEYEVRGYSELGGFFPDEDTPCPHCEEEEQV